MTHNHHANSSNIIKIKPSFNCDSLLVFTARSHPNTIAGGNQSF
jgi:hypothetical protein